MYVLSTQIQGRKNVQLEHDADKLRRGRIERSQISVAQCSLEVRRQEGRGEKEGETFKYIGSKSVYLQIMIASHCSNLFVPAVCEGTPDILGVAARYDTTRLKITQYTMP